MSIFVRLHIFVEIVRGYNHGRTNILSTIYIEWCSQSTTMLDAGPRYDDIMMILLWYYDEVMMKLWWNYDNTKEGKMCFALFFWFPGRSKKKTTIFKRCIPPFPKIHCWCFGETESTFEAAGRINFEFGGKGGMQILKMVVFFERPGIAPSTMNRASFQFLWNLQAVLPS